MKDGRARWRDEFLRTALVDLLIYVFGLVFTSSLFVAISKLLQLKLEILAQLRWYLGVVFGSGGAFLFVVLYGKFAKHRPRFPKIDFDFRVVEKDIRYEESDAGEIVYKKRLVLSAMKEGLEVYHDRYHWTGSGPAIMKSTFANQEVRNTFKKNVWQYYEIRFPSVLAKGEEIETEIVWNLSDPSHTAVPFISTSIDEPTNQLKLGVRLPPQSGAHEVTVEISSGLGAKRPFSSKRLALDRDGRATWQPPRPKLLHYYEMRWIPVTAAERS